MENKILKADRENALKMLREVLQSGDTVHTVLRNVSRSGMMRKIDIYKIVQYKGRDGVLEAPRLQYLSGWAAAVLDYKTWPRDGLRINGCGMDMGFAIVDNLRAAVFGWEKTEHGTRAKGELRQEWI